MTINTYCQKYETDVQQAIDDAFNVLDGLKQLQAFTTTTECEEPCLPVYARTIYAQKRLIKILLKEQLITTAYHERVPSCKYCRNKNAAGILAANGDFR